MMQVSIKPRQLNVSRDSAVAFLILTTALIFLSFTAIFIRISLADISADATLFNRLWIAAILFGAWNGARALKSNSQQTATAARTPAKKVVVLLVLVAIIHVLGRFLMTWSLTQTSIAKVTLLANMPPIFTMLGAWLIFKQTFDRQFIYGMAIALSGAVILGLSDVALAQTTAGFEGISIWGDAAALSSSLCYAASFLIIEQLRSTISTQNILFWRCLIGAIAMLPLVLLSGMPVLPTSAASWGAVIALAVICEALGHGLVVHSLDYFSATFVNVFLLLESVLTATFAYIIFAEGIDLVNLIPFALILGGILMTKVSNGASVAKPVD